MEFPQIHFGEIKDSVDWRKSPDSNDEIDDDAPASPEVIAMLGFDPDKETYDDEPTETKDSLLTEEKIRRFIEKKKARIQKNKMISKPTEIPVIPDNTPKGINSNGVVYKTYTITQEPDGNYAVYAMGGSFVERFISLPLAMSRIDQVSPGE